MFKVLGWVKPAELWLSGAFCRDVISRSLEKHFCLTSTTFYVSSVHVFSHLYLTNDFLFWELFIVKTKQHTKKVRLGLCVLAVEALNHQSLGVFTFDSSVQCSSSFSGFHLLTLNVMLSSHMYSTVCLCFYMNRTIGFTLAIWGTTTFWDSWGFDVNKE